MPELDKKRLVKTQIGTQGRNLVGFGILPQQKHHRVAHVLKQHEGDERHTHHHKDGLNQAAKNEDGHLAAIRRTAHEVNVAEHTPCRYGVFTGLDRVTVA